jgi:VanZ family protein
VEFALNVLVVTPVPFLAGWAGARWSWERWTAYAFVAAVVVETIQGLVMPNRSAQFQDVAANTLGILLGSLLSLLFVRRRGLRTTERGDRPLRL